MKIKLTLFEMDGKDWSDLFSVRYQRLFNLSDIDRLKIHDEKLKMIYKHTYGDVENDLVKLTTENHELPEARTLGINGLGYWLGWVNWSHKTYDNAQGNKVTELKGHPSKFWVSAPIVMIGVVFAIWVFRSFLTFLNPLTDNSTLYFLIGFALVALIGVSSYFVHCLSVKRIFKQITVFLKYKGIPFEFCGDKYDPSIPMDPLPTKDSTESARIKAVEEELKAQAELKAQSEMKAGVPEHALSPQVEDEVKNAEQVASERAFEGFESDDSMTADYTPETTEYRPETFDFSPEPDLIDSKMETPLATTEDEEVTVDFAPVPESEHQISDEVSVDEELHLESEQEEQETPEMYASEIGTMEGLTTDYISEASIAAEQMDNAAETPDQFGADSSDEDNWSEEYVTAVDKSEPAESADTAEPHSKIEDTSVYSAKEISHSSGTSLHKQENEIDMLFAEKSSSDDSIFTDESSSQDESMLMISDSGQPDDQKTPIPADPVASDDSSLMIEDLSDESDDAFTPTEKTESLIEAEMIGEQFAKLEGDLTDIGEEIENIDSNIESEDESIMDLSSTENSDDNLQDLPSTDFSKVLVPVDVVSQSTSGKFGEFDNQNENIASEPETPQEPTDTQEPGEIKYGDSSYLVPLPAEEIPAPGLIDNIANVGDQNKEPESEVVTDVNRKQYVDVLDEVGQRTTEIGDIDDLKEDFATPFKTDQAFSNGFAPDVSPDVTPEYGATAGFDIAELAEQHEEQEIEQTIEQETDSPELPDLAENTAIGDALSSESIELPIADEELDETNAKEESNIDIDSHPKTNSAIESFLDDDEDSASGFVTEHEENFENESNASDNLEDFQSFNAEEAFKEDPIFGFGDDDEDTDDDDWEDDDWETSSEDE